MSFSAVFDEVLRAASNAPNCFQQANTEASDGAGHAKRNAPCCRASWRGRRCKIHGWTVSEVGSREEANGIHRRQAMCTGQQLRGIDLDGRTAKAHSMKAAGGSSRT